VGLLVTPLSSSMVLAPNLVEFHRQFPDVVLEVATTQEGHTELVAAGFDAGIHLGESIQPDMVAVRVSRDQRLAVVGSPNTSRRTRRRIHHTIYRRTDASMCGLAPRDLTAGSSRKTARVWSST
jgi:DNA-binding transcriptional LysR family regulator